MNSINNNPFRNSNINMENNNILNNTSPKMKKIDKFEQPIAKNFLNKIKEEIEKAQLICVKIVRGEEVSKKDLEFISKKYPDMKQMAEESLKDYNNIIKELKLCKDHDEVEQLLFKFSKETSNTAKNGYLSELQSKIKATIMEEMIKSSKNIKSELDNAEKIALKIVKGEEITSNQENFLKQKYPHIKQMSQQTLKYINDLKIDLNNCKTQQEREQLLSKEIKNLDSKKNILSKTEIKFKMAGIEQVQKFLNNNKKDNEKLRLIALKIIKNKTLTKSEEKFISEKYPNLKEEIREYEYLKELFKDYKYKEEILDKELKKIEQQIVSSKITEHQAIIKKAIIEDIKKENEYGIYYYMNLYLHMIFNKISENSLGIIILTILIITMMYIF